MFEREIITSNNFFLIKRLYDLGFEYIPESIINGSNTPDDFHLYFEDLKTTRELSTKEEFSDSEYFQVLLILTQLNERYNS